MDYPITYELTTESGAQSNDFAIDSRSGVVDLLRILDYETDPVEYHLRVKAIENRRHPVTSTVNVWGPFFETQCSLHCLLKLNMWSVKRCHFYFTITLAIVECG